MPRNQHTLNATLALRRRKRNRHGIKYDRALALLRRPRKRLLRGGLLVTVPLATSLLGSLGAKGLLATAPGQKAEKWAGKAGKDREGWFVKTFGKKKKKKGRWTATGGRRPGPSRRLPTLNDLEPYKKNKK